MACLDGITEELDHHVGHLPACLCTDFPCGCPHVQFRECSKHLLVVFGRHEARGNGQEGRAVRPPEGEEAVSFLEPVLVVIEHTGREFRPFDRCPLIHGVIDDESVRAVLFGERADLRRDERRQGDRKFCPVDAGVVKETVESILGEARASGAGKHLPVDAATREHIGEDEAEDVHDGHALLLCRADGSEKACDMERAEEKGYGVSGLLEILVSLRYNSHSISPLSCVVLATTIIRDEEGLCLLFVHFFLAV